MQADGPQVEQSQASANTKATGLEVFLISSYYQKNQHRRNPLKARFRVVKVCNIPHPYKERIDRLVAKVEGPNAILGSPNTYRGQVLRLLCNLLFPLEASYISDQLLSYRVIRSLSGSNLPVLVRMGLSTDVTLARNQRGHLCQYIKVFFLSELIYQRRIKCKEYGSAGSSNMSKWPKLNYLLHDSAHLGRLKYFFQSRFDF